MAALAFVGQEPFDDVADQRLHLRDDGCERVAVAIVGVGRAASSHG